MNQYGRDVQSPIELSVKENNDTQVISSLEVANMVGREHKNVMQDIRGIIKRLGLTESQSLFLESVYVDSMNRQKPCYNLTKEGCELYARRLRGQTHIKLLKFINDTFGAEKSLEVFIPERKEKLFFEKLEETLKPFDLTLTKQMAVCGKYRIDAVIEALDIAIEYDEYEHQYKTTNDIERQTEITTTCGFHFVRVHEKYSDEYNIGLVLKKVMEVSR